MTTWKPDNYPSMSPYLICNDAEALIRFVETAFDGKLLRRFDRPDGSLMHAEVRIDDSVLMVGGGATGAQGSSVHIHVYVPDVLTVFDRAVAAGASVVQKPERKRADDDLRGGVQDVSGTTWWIASQ
jgi:PhnB protein